MKFKNKLQQIPSILKQFQAVDTTLVSTLYTLSIKSLLTAIVFAILIAIFLYSELSYSIVLWCFVLVILLSFRLYHAYVFKTTPHIHSTEKWYKKFMISSLITGVLISMLGAVFIHYLNDYYQLFVLTALLGLTAGATMSLSSDLRISTVYISILMLPLIISMTMIHSSLAFILPVLMILFYSSQILMIFNSYTQNKELKALKGQHNLLDNLFSEVPLGMLSYDKNLNVLYANTYLHKIFDYKGKELMGLNLNALRDTKIIDILHHVLTEGPQSYTGPYIAINGDRYWVETTWLPFKDVNDTTIGGVGIIEDKTKEHMNQLELKSLHFILKDQVEKNQFLLAENKQFIADMVHQIRTPLSVIMTNTSLIEMNSEPKVSPYVTQINSAISMLSNAYEDLSYIISNDTMEYKPIDIDLTHFLQERIHFFEVIAQANEKTIYTTIANDIRIMMNDTELERLIDNNISNAIKHSNEKSQIKIVLVKTNAEPILRFISNGKNINNVSMIFDRNYTETHSAKRSLGLGLSMVKTICEKNRIDYSASSEEGINTFTYIFKS